MEFSGRPLLDTRIDKPLYLRRPVHAELFRRIEHGENVLVLGPRGSGKTTLLNQVAADLRQQSKVVAQIDGRWVTSVIEFLRLLRVTLVPTATDPSLLSSISQVFPPHLGYTKPASWDTDGDVIEPLSIIQKLSEELGDTRHVVLCDELPSQVAHIVFGRLRDEVWQLPIAWIVAGDDANEYEYRTPPADAFFERLIRIPPLNDIEQRQLLALRVGNDDETLMHIMGANANTPRDLLSVARLALDEQRDPTEMSLANAEIDNRVAALGQASAMAFSELKSLGPSSASDEKFLRRLQWTRERATQVLNRLEDAGLVESFNERSGRGGRPKKIYRVRGVA